MTYALENILQRGLWQHSKCCQETKTGEINNKSLTTVIICDDLHLKLIAAGGFLCCSFASLNFSNDTVSYFGEDLRFDLKPEC